MGEHYGVVGQAVLNSLAIALGRYWQEPVKNAWLKTWTTIVSVMFPEEEAKLVENAETAGAVEESKPAEAAEEVDKKKDDEEAKKKKAEALKKKEAAAKKKKEEAEKKKVAEEAA